MNAWRTAFLLGLPLAAQSLTPETAISAIEKTLTGNILPFWYPRTLDRKYGGYTINHDINGHPKGEGPKVLVTQARMVWFYARMARAGYGDRRQMLEAADHGYRFLVSKMWDPKHGGFYWEVDATGEKKTKPKKHLYAQSFGLYALSELAVASGRKDVLNFATRFFDLLERKAHDGRYGGYREFFHEDWTPVESERGYMSARGDLKLMNTHIHIIEAVTAFYRASKLPLARERLYEMIAIESNAVIRKTAPAATDQYKLDWTPILEGAGNRVNYGHDIENIWLLADASAALQAPVAPLMDLFRNVFAYSMKYGWDEKDGGFWYWGELNKPASSRTKAWWVQAEVLIGALTMYNLTGEPQYWQVFEKTWDFLNRHQIDWKNGDWWANVDENLKPSGDKAGAWKAAYHNGRAMIESIRLIRENKGVKP